MTSVWRPYPDATVEPPPAPAEQLRFSVTLTLAAVPTAVGAARRYVRSELASAGLAALIEDAELVASELVTNAIKATGVMATEPTWVELEGLAVIRIRLCFAKSSVFIEVWDHDATQPKPKVATADDVSGRGLLIVTSLCVRWNVRRVPAGGKVVWAELTKPVPQKLPRREPNRRLAPNSRGIGPSYRAADRSDEEVSAMRTNGGGGTRY
jgi:anti-sigma regulatory factor (Ser/Thr protein kinase)